MTSRRSQIAMTDSEVLRFLQSQQKAVLVSNGANGFPHPVHMFYHCDSAGDLWMTSYAKAMKVRNLERDPRASIVVETSESYAAARAVILFTRAEILRDSDLVEWVFAKIAEKGLPELPVSAFKAGTHARSSKRVVLKLTREDATSWDHAKLDGAY